jgi:thymidylate synthase (FAD)
MKTIEQSHEILSMAGIDMIELAGRTCYQSQDKIDCFGRTAPKFVKMLRDRGHHAMIEFGDIIVKFVTNRGVTHELVRHRHCSFAQESTRYVKYDGDMEFIQPVWMEGANTATTTTWTNAMIQAESNYKYLLRDGWTAQQAREVLPNSLKTEIVAKANIREWRHILKLRCAKSSHPQMVALMRPLLAELQSKIPVVFDDLDFKE